MDEPGKHKEVASRLGQARRVVVKVGTNTVTGPDGEFNAERVEPLVRSLAALKHSSRQVVLVSSGAVGLGAGRLGLARPRLNDLVTRQVCSAVGQNLLMNAYENLFSKYGVKIAQVLLTEDDFKDRTRYGNLRSTMEKLLKFDVLPVVNENDTVSTAELEYSATQERIFGDNDRLAALVMSKLEADALILLTNVDGLLQVSDDSDQRAFQVVPLVEEVTAELKSLASGTSTGGRGGMLSKLEAAEIAMRAGGVAVIANGQTPFILDRLFAGQQLGTAFVSSVRLDGKRRWIAYAANVRGRVIVNAGAREAILNSKASLLTSGVVRVENEFDSLDVVSIVDGEGNEFARGMASCGSREALKLLDEKDKLSSIGQSPFAKTGVLVSRENILILKQ